jgi:hypothetical protein
MTFGYHCYRVCPHCGYLGALSNHGKQRGKMAGHYRSSCKYKNLKFNKALPFTTKKAKQLWKRYHE